MDRDMFTIEDTRHSHLWLNYSTFELALAEIQRRVSMPWDAEPNKAPCTSWRTCGCSYVVNKWDITITPFKRLKTTSIVEIDSEAVRWEPDFAPTLT